MDFSRIPALEGEVVHVVVESPRGSPVKLMRRGLAGDVDLAPAAVGRGVSVRLGFVPPTLAEDGDPLDATVLWAVPSFPGVVLRCRPVAIMYVEQNKTNFDSSVRVHNDPVMLEPMEARREAQTTDSRPSRRGCARNWSTLPAAPPRSKARTSG